MAPLWYFALSCGHRPPAARRVSQVAAASRTRTRAAASAQWGKRGKIGATVESGRIFTASTRSFCLRISDDSSCIPLSAVPPPPLSVVCLAAMSRGSYAPVSSVALNEVALENADPAAAAAADAAEDAAAPTSESRRLLTKRRIYSAHRVERRTPRLPHETDEAYARRVNMQYLSGMLHSIGWVAAACAVLYFTDLWNVVRFDTRVNRSARASRCSCHAQVQHSWIDGLPGDSWE